MRDVAMEKAEGLSKEKLEAAVEDRDVAKYG